MKIFLVALAHCTLALQYPAVLQQRRVASSYLIANQRRWFGCHAQRVESEAGFHDVAEGTLEQIQDAVEAVDEELDNVEVDYSVACMRYHCKQ